MQITITKDQLIKGLQSVQNIVSTRTTLPILSNVLLTADNGKLQLMATDLDVAITCGVDAKVDTAGAATVPAKKLFGIVKELSELDIDLSVNDKAVCSVRSGSSAYKINGLPAEEFPPLPKFVEEKKITLPQGTVRRMIQHTSFAISTDESRFVLNGIFVTIKDGKLTMVATDGRRLALVDETTDVAKEGEGEFIVPTKTVNELNRLLQDKGEVDLSYSDRQASFAMRDEAGVQSTVFTKLVEGTYPNFRQVIPAEAKEKIALQREEFMHALSRAQIMTSEKANSVKLSFTKDKLVITANTPELGEARETIAVNYKGADMAIAFNPRYVLDTVGALPDDEVSFELIDEISPAVIRTKGSFLSVIMPMRLS